MLLTRSLRRSFYLHVQQSTIYHYLPSYYSSLEVRAVKLDLLFPLTIQKPLLKRYAMNLVEAGPIQTFVWNDPQVDENKLAGLKGWESHQQYLCLDGSCANKK